MVKIPNKIIKEIIKILPKTVSSGSYARNTHLDEYKDLDLITLINFDEIIKILSKKYKIIIKRKGSKLMTIILDDKYLIDFWFSENKDNFWKLFITHFLPKHHIIAINKKLM